MDTEFLGWRSLGYSLTVERVVNATRPIKLARIAGILEREGGRRYFSSNIAFEINLANNLSPGDKSFPVTGHYEPTYWDPDGHSRVAWDRIPIIIELMDQTINQATGSNYTGRIE